MSKQTKLLARKNLRQLTASESEIENIAKRLGYSVFRVLYTVDNMTYSIADRFADNYTGGMWTYYTSEENPAIFLMEAPTNVDAYNVSVYLNCYEGQMTPRAFGFGITLMVLNMMLGEDPSEEKIAAYYQTRDFALDVLSPDEITQFLGFID
jgi:hypothetical protein